MPFRDLAKAREYNRLQQQKYRLLHPESCRARSRRYQQKHKEQTQAYARSYRERNKEKLNAQGRARYHADPLRNRRQQLSKYGITPEQYDTMLAAQGGKCAICRKAQVRPFHVDHSHVTDKVRGLLCGRCNRGLGFFGDLAETLASAIDYLRTHE